MTMTTEERTLLLAERAAAEERSVIARYSGPLHGVVLRRKSHAVGDYVLHGFNTPAAVERYGYVGGYYDGDYLGTLDEALAAFAERVQRALGRVPGEVADRNRKDRVDR